MKYYNSDGFEGSKCRREVEEALSCGTGATDSAIVSVISGQIDKTMVPVS